MKIPLSKLLVAFNAIHQIGHLRKAPIAVYALHVNLLKLRPEALALEKAKTILCQEFFGKPVPDTSHSRYHEFESQYRQLLEKEVDFEPAKFKFSDLNGAENDLNPVITVQLEWMMES